MLPIICEIPLPFELFGHDHLSVRSFGLMVVLGLMVGNHYATRYCRRVGIADEVMANLLLVFIVSLMLGARALYVVVNWAQFSDDPFSMFAIHKGGMVYYGSFLGILCGLFVFVRFTKTPAWDLMDVSAIGAAIGMAVGRVGCLLVGDDYGRVCDESFPLAIKFPTRTEPGSLFGMTISPDNGNLAGFMQGKWLHPTQIYMSLNALALFFLLRWIWTKRQFPGQVAAVFFLYYAVSRSVIEHYRGDDLRGFVGTLSTSQFISIFVFIAGAILYAVLKRRGQSVSL
jgi:phosphatidylglycerol:prolipoprotein diacylglycerol transferase